MMNIIELVKSLTSDDTGLFQKLVCIFYGKRQTLKKLGMYGISFRPPDNSFGIALKANGYDDESFVAVDYPQGRFKDLEPGELKIGNYLTGDYVYFKADGTIEIKASTFVNIIGNVAVSGTVTAANFASANVSNYDTHTHGGVDSGVDNTDGPN